MPIRLYRDNPLREENPVTPVEVAEAFCTHRFDAAYVYLADDVSWNMVGGEELHGKETVVERCESSTRELDGVPVTLLRKRSITSGDTVVVETLTEYVDGGDSTASLVASCDVFDFAGTTVARITSYVLEAQPHG